MNRARIPFLAALLATSMITATLVAKGSTVRLTIAGPGLSSPLELTSPAAIAANVYGGNFIGNRATEPDKAFPRYTVSFYVELPGSSIPRMLYVEPPEEIGRMMYVVYYARNPRTGQGFVYLPGRDDGWYRFNIHTIGREEQDGKWHEATPAWSAAIAAALPQAQ
jgi:hypothetical protein